MGVWLMYIIVRAYVREKQRYGDGHSTVSDI